MSTETKLALREPKQDSPKNTSFSLFVMSYLFLEVREAQSPFPRLDLWRTPCGTRFETSNFNHANEYWGLAFGARIMPTVGTRDVAA
jgi:hypothetical protein